MTTTLLPTPYVDPGLPSSSIWTETISTPASGTGWGADDDGRFLPIVFPADCAVYGLRAIGANTTGNYDLGFYSPAGALLTSKGSTALSAAVLEHTFSDIRVKAGETYYLAMALSSNSGSAWRSVSASGNRPRMMGILTQSSAVPLPSTMSPSWPSGDTIIPFIVVLIR